MLKDEALQRSVGGVCAEEKKAEEALRDAKEKWDSLTANTDDIIMIVDSQGVIQYINRTIPPYTPEDTIGKTVYEYVPREQHDVMRKSLTKVFKTREPDSYEVSTNIPKIGSMWFRTKVVPIKRDRKAVAVIMISTDITELKKTEEALVRLSSAVKMSADSIVISDLNAEIIDVNEATLKMYRASDKEDLIGKNSFALVAPEEREKALAGTKEVLEKGYLKGREYHVVTKDGSRIPVEMSVAIMKDADGKPIGFVGISRDITERKQAEEVLAYERDLLQALMDNIPDAIYFKDAESRFTRTNKAHSQMIGVTDPKAAMGKTDFDFYAEEFAREAYADEREIVKTGKPMVNKVEKIRRPDGFFQWVSASKVPITDEMGRVIGIVGISRDITERKEMEEKLERYSERLQDLVEQRTRELKQAQQRLLNAERLAAIGETAAMVGHDLRNPLQVMSNLLYIGKKMLEEIPSRCRKIAVEMGIEDLFGNVAKQIEYMNKIASDLQDYARPLKPEFAPTRLYTLINETLSTLTIPETVKVSMTIPKDFPNIVVDSSLMKRLFTNLITNALQAMLDGGQLTIRLEQTESTAVISIEDTGLGIPKENLDKLFQPLFTTKPRGTGFGLPACKRIVEAHKGSITVESELGRGSTFTVSIPHTREVSQTG